jgi:hypothetical protein
MRVRRRASPHAATQSHVSAALRHRAYARNVQCVEALLERLGMRREAHVVVIYAVLGREWRG